jgi:dTDP-4-amino-4,6-dideoxygalactose transaminase
MATVSKTTFTPPVNLRTQYEPLKGEIMDAISTVLDDMHLFQGTQQQAFEREFARFCGCGDAIAVSNGTDALELALRAAGVQPGDEVVTQPTSFIATAEAISSVGARPVIVDVDPDTAILDPALLEPSITPRTKAIIPVHLYGMPANMSAIMELARRHDLLVIEDACQAHRAQQGDQRVGSCAPP